jgi:hypothetical protein
MFHFLFRKRTFSIILLTTIIILSTVFSLLFNIQITEGLLTKYPTVYRPTAREVYAMLYVLTRKEYKNWSIFKKLDYIKPITIKYKLMTDIIENNETDYYYALRDYITIQSKFLTNDNTAKKIITPNNKILANQILSNKNLTTREKIIKIKNLTGEDKTLKSIQSNYERDWNSILLQYLNNLIHKKFK